MTKIIDTERRLAAIFAADVEGYSRLMGADEVGTLRDLTQRRSILDGLIAVHRGRIANTAGDSVLAEFGSAVDAVRCAVEAQAALAEANSGASPERHINFRIGVHVGDVMVRAGDLFGDGVNIAARLQTLASAGGVCVSGVAHDQVRKILPFVFVELGAQKVKNIEDPIRAFAISAEDTAVADRAGFVSATVDNNKPLALPDKPSIAVLPFQNMSGDPEQEYFADGMVEDIITGLSRSKSLFVIARNSSFTYKGRAVDIKQVGRELGVRYVLEGSVRKSGDRVRITGQLIEAENGHHIWADKFDSKLEDIFDLQDKMTSSVVGAISPQLERAEIERARRKPTENLQAYDYYLRALYNTYAFTREANIEVLALSEIASTIDPVFALAYALGANSFVQRKSFGWTMDGSLAENHARKLARRAVELDKDDPLVLAMAGQVHTHLLGEVENGAALLKRAVSLDPNLAPARYWGGWAQVYLGNLDAATSEFLMAIRLSPIDPRIFIAQTGLAHACFLAGHYIEGLSWAKLGIQHQPNFPAAHRIAMSCLAMLGRLEEAQLARVVALRIDPTVRISNLRDRAPWRPEDLKKVSEAYRIAGVPE